MQTGQKVRVRLHMLNGGRLSVFCRNEVSKYNIGNIEILISSIYFSYFIEY